MTKTLKVSEDTFWKLKALAVERRVPMAALIGEMVETVPAAPKVKNPAQGWRKPATETAEVARPLPAQKATPPAPMIPPTKRVLSADEIRALHASKSAKSPPSARAAMRGMAEADGPPDLKVEYDDDPNT